MGNGGGSRAAGRRSFLAGRKYLYLMAFRIFYCVLGGFFIFYFFWGEGRVVFFKVIGIGIRYEEVKEL